MLRTGLSMIPATLALSGYNIADTYFVSRLGTLPLAAMGFTFPVVMLTGCVYRGIAIGAMTPLAHALGGGRHGRASRVASAGLLLMLLSSVVIGTAGYLSIDGVFRLFGADGAVMGLIAAYMGVWYMGSVSGALALACNDFLIALGSTRIASAMMVVGMLLNVGLDPLFIFGWGPVPAMGVKGAALATVLSQLCSAGVLLSILHFRYRLLTRGVFDWRLLRRVWLVIVGVAVPSTIGTLMMPAGNAVITRIVAGFGDEVVAACAAAGRLEMVAFVVPMSLGMSLMPMIGQNFGAGRYDRINECRRFAMRFAALFEIFMALLYFILAPRLASLFSESPRVVEVMTIYLRIIPFGFGLMEIHRYCGFIYTGCGRASMSAALNALRLFGLLVPFSLLALYFHSLSGLFAGRLAADVLSGCVGLWLVRGMTRRLHGDGATELPGTMLRETI